MSDRQMPEPLVLDFDLDAPPAKVWRAMTIPEFRDRWLPGKTLADEAPLAIDDGRLVRYAVRDELAPSCRSEVTFVISPGADGGTRFRIIHQLSEAPRMVAANGNTPPSARMAA